MIDRDRCQRFAAALARLDSPEDAKKKPDVGTLACLRRGVGKTFGQDSIRDGWVLHTLETIRGERPDDWAEQDIEWACCVASLFAGHRGISSDSLGKAYRKLWQSRGEAASIARRFTTLIDADEQDLAIHLRHAVSLLKAEDISLDWGKLLFNVTHWRAPDRRVQRYWNRDFWLDTTAKHHRTSHTTH